MGPCAVDPMLEDITKMGRKGAGGGGTLEEGDGLPQTLRRQSWALLLSSPQTRLKHGICSAMVTLISPISVYFEW